MFVLVKPYWSHSIYYKDIYDGMFVLVKPTIPELNKNENKKK